ncbi:MAG: hypothetical protein PHX74_10635 [Candidatus Sumerlaeales bacterium]|nr:hypothetical protein [Candidatus Sumerlaeales bacterium]
MERNKQSDYLAIKVLAAMAEKKFKMAKANPDNKTTKLEAQILFYAANAINETINKEEEDVVECGEAQ